MLFIILLLALSPYFYTFKENVLSDIPFLFFSLSAIFLIELFIIEKKYLFNRSFSFFLLGASIFLVYFIREPGILLIPLVMFCQFIEKKESLSFKNLSNKINLAIPYLTFFILLMSSKYLLPANSYSNSLSELTIKYVIDFSLQNVYYYSTLLADFFGDPDLISDYFHVRSINISYVIYGISLLFFVLGVIKNYRKNYLYLTYFLLNLVLFIIWPYRQGLRYIFELIPLYLFFLFKGLIEMDETKLFSSRIKVTHVFIAMLLIFFISQILFISVFYYKSDKSKEGPYTFESMEMFNFIKGNTEKDDTIVFFRPRAFSLFTDRFSISIESYEKLINSTADYFVNYKNQFSGNVKIKSESEENYSLLLSKIINSDKLIKIFGNKDFEIYKIKKD